MVKEESAKKGRGVVVYLIFLVPAMLTALLVFAASIEKEMQDSGQRQTEGGAFSEETVRPHMLSDELQPEYKVKELDGGTVTRRI